VLALAPRVTIVCSSATLLLVVLSVATDEGEGIARKMEAVGPMLYPQVLLGSVVGIVGGEGLVLGSVLVVLVWVRAVLEVKLFIVRV